MTPPPLPMKGRNVGVYGFLDGNRGAFWGDLGAGGTPHRAHAGVGLVWSQQIWLWVPVELRPVDRNGWIGARRKG